MPAMTRQQYSTIADATADIIKAAGRVLIGDAFEAFRAEASALMTKALTGESSSFNPDRFRERCLGIRRGR